MPTNLKRMVRERMEKTGESYQQALRHVRAEDGSRREGDQIILGPTGGTLAPWTPDNYQPPARHDDYHRRAAAIVAQQNSQPVPPPIRLSPWAPDPYDYTSDAVRITMERQRRNVAAVITAQQNGQVVPPSQTVGQLSGQTSIEVKLTGVVARGELGSLSVEPRVELIGIGALLSAQLAADPSMLHQLSPGQFQEFLCDRLAAMGQEVKLVGGVYEKDGGIDILFWPKSRNVVSVLGAVQAKHHRNPSTKVGSPIVRDFAGAISGRQFGAAILATNTAFTPDAEWFAREHARLIKLRDFGDMQRWIANDYREERREMPDEIELCPGVIVKIPRE